VVNEWGEEVVSTIPCERALTVYVDKRELVTLMTLGAYPELLVLGFLRNQGLVESLSEVESITVDWEVGAAAVKTRRGIERIEERTAQRVVTTGCGQGSVFGALMDGVDRIVLPNATLSQSELYGLVNAIRVQESIYRQAGSVHGCALFRGQEMLVFIEDVGRHNAIDTIAGWMWMNSETPAVNSNRSQSESGTPGADKVLYTTGRLTSEMVIKAAQMGIPIVVSRSGITEMGLEVAKQLGLCAIGRATNKRFLCYSAFERLQLQPELAGARLRCVA
jgi:FdhD protein